MELYEFTEKLNKNICSNMDDCIIQFLNKNGYPIEEPYDAAKLKYIKADLESKDMYLDTIQYIDYENLQTGKLTHYVIPFFNRISCPLSEDDKKELIEKYMKENNKND